jgi:hypothetical protein
LKYFDENHLAKVLLRRSLGAMGADDLADQWIKPLHQRASCIIVVLKSSLNKSACVRIIHVIKSASTLLTMTSAAAHWLQLRL